MKDNASVQAPDWNLIQVLYQKGLTPKAIEAQTGVKAGTVSVTAHRKGWRKALFAASAMMKGVGEYTQSDSPSDSKHQAQSERVRSGLAATLERSVKALETMTLTSPKHALKVNQELEPMVRNAKTVFGWSDSTTQPLVRIAILQACTPAQPQPNHAMGYVPNAVPAQPVIDLVPSPQEKELLSPRPDGHD